MIIEMNGIEWDVIEVHPNSEYLIDRENILTLGTTDPVTHCVYISNKLVSPLKEKVISHELGHVACFSYGLLEEIHMYTYPEHWIDMEEFICNFVADYGKEIWNITEDLTKVKMWIEKVVS